MQEYPLCSNLLPEEKEEDNLLDDIKIAAQQVGSFLCPPYGIYNGIKQNLEVRDQFQLVNNQMNYLYGYCNYFETTRPTYDHLVANYATSGHNHDSIYLKKPEFESTMSLYLYSQEETNVRFKPLDKFEGGFYNIYGDLNFQGTACINHQEIATIDAVLRILDEREPTVCNLIDVYCITDTSVCYFHGSDVYHRTNCYHAKLQKGLYLCSEKNAKDIGLEPCKDCFGDIA